MATPKHPASLLLTAIFLLPGCVGSGSGSDPNNQPPEISDPGLTISSSVVMPGESVELSVRATDPDGDDLTYLWSEASDAGSFEPGSDGTSCTWTAPETEGAYELRVAARDTAGHETAVATSVAVASTLQVPSDAYPTIQSALDVAQPGMTIEVAAGTYEEDLSIKEPVHLVGAGPESTIVRGTGTGPVLAPDFSRPAGVTVEGFTFEGGATGVQVSSTADFTLRNCVVRDNSENGIELFSSPATIESCRITGNSGNGIDVRSSAATIQGCLVAENAGNGVEISSSAATVRFCTLADNVGYGIRVYQSNAQILDSILADNDFLNFNEATLLGATGLSISSAHPYLGRLLLFHDEIDVDDNHLNGEAVIVDGVYVTGDGADLANGGDPLLSTDGDYTLADGSPAATLAGDGGELGAYGGGYAPPPAP